MNATARRLTALVTFLAMAFCAIFLIATPALAADDNYGSDSMTDFTDPIKIDYNYDSGQYLKTKYFQRNDDTAKIIPDILVKEGTFNDYVFCGWSTEPDQTSPGQVQYNPGDKVPTDKSLTLYAVWATWELGEHLTAAGNGTSYVYDGNYHSISGVNEKPKNDRTSYNGHSLADGYFHLDSAASLLWYDYYAAVYNIQASGKDVNSYTTPSSAIVYRETTTLIGGHSWEVLGDAAAKVTPATMHITKAPLKVTAEDQRVKYSGKDITPEGTLEGLVTPTDEGENKGKQETATFTMASFKEVGAHPMTYSIDWNGTAKQNNYEVTEEKLGTLTIYCDLIYDANGGKGAPEKEEIETSEATVSSTKPTRDGYNFLGWATTKDATKAEFQPGDTIAINSIVDDNGEATLFAVWEEVKKEVPKEAPKTGDTNNMMGVAGLCVLSLAGVVTLLVVRRRKHQ